MTCGVVEDLFTRGRGSGGTALMLHKGDHLLLSTRYSSSEYTTAIPDYVLSSHYRTKEQIRLGSNL